MFCSITISSLFYCCCDYDGHTDNEHADHLRIFDNLRRAFVKQTYQLPAVLHITALFNLFVNHAHQHFGELTKFVASTEKEAKLEEEQKIINLVNVAHDVLASKSIGPIGPCFFVYRYLWFAVC